MDEMNIDQVNAAATQNEHRSNSIDPGGRRLSVLGRRISIVDDVFREIVEGDPNYRNVHILLLVSRKANSQSFLGGLV